MGVFVVILLVVVIVIIIVKKKSDSANAAYSYTPATNDTQSNSEDHAPADVANGEIWQLTINAKLSNWSNVTVYEKLILDKYGLCNFYRNFKNNTFTKKEFECTANIGDKTNDILEGVRDLILNGEASPDYVSQDRTEEIARMSGTITATYLDGGKITITLFTETENINGLGIYGPLRNMCDIVIQLGG